MRGAITEEIEKLSEELLGEKITTKQLRLMPYLQYLVMNSQRLELNKINDEEGKILTDWRLKGFISDNQGKVVMTKDFWEAISRICWLGYVNI